MKVLRKTIEFKNFEEFQATTERIEANGYDLVAATQYGTGKIKCDYKANACLKEEEVKNERLYP